MPTRHANASRIRRSLYNTTLAILIWALLAYVVLPAAWKLFEHLHPTANSGLRTRTGAGIPGDPLNLALVGTKTELIAAMTQAGWHRADPLTLGSGIKIAGSVIFGWAYDTAPVSTLYYLSRAQDIAFEKPISLDADRRHHVRFWQMSSSGAGKPVVWLGAASEDISIGLNHLTGQFTHHISPDIDQERDGVIADLTASGGIGPATDIPGIGPVSHGRNGEDDRFFTEGLIRAAPLATAP